MEFLINLTIKSTLIILLSLLLLKVLQKNAAALRHWVISLSMIGLLGLPLFIGILPSMQVEVPFLAKQVSPTTEIGGNQDMPNFQNLAYLSTSKVTEKKPSPNAINKSEIHQPIIENNNVIAVDNKSIDSQISTKKSSVNTIPLSTILLVIWLLGSCCFLFKFLIGLFSIWSITRNSHPFSLPTIVQEAAIQIMQKNVQFLVSPSINTPMTWGTFRPVVLLPMTTNEWTVSELKAVVVHELSHIKRGDYWIHTLGLLTVCLYWYNPLIWWMKKQQLLEREKACDEAVLRSGIQRQNYAEQLLQITRCLSKPTTIIHENALPMAKVSQLKKRIIAILNFEENSYRFSKWKQWQWGLFYGGLFPVLAAFSPVGQQVIQEHLPLPKLEMVAQYLDTKNKEISISIPKETLSIKETKVIVPLSLSDKYDQSIGNLDTQNDSRIALYTQTLEPLSRLLTTNIRPLEIKTTSINTSPSGYFSEWKQGKSEFKIWTYGDFKTYGASPYIEVTSPDGMVIVEETRKNLFGTKKYRLVITKAPHDGALVQTFIADKPNSWTYGIKEGDPLHLWYVDEEWAFLAKGKDTWISEALSNQFVPLSQLTNSSLQKKTQEDADWWKTIQQYQEIINKRYVEDPDEVAKRENLNLPKVQLSEIPFKAIQSTQLTGQFKKIGRTKATKTTAGLSGYENIKGYKFGTILKSNNQKGILENFHFNIHKRKFESLELDLYFFKVDNNEIQHALMEKPVRITINEKEKGWIKRNLSAHQIGIEGDVLVVMEIADYTARQTSLFFALAPTHVFYKPTDLFCQGKKLEFWDAAFAWYATVKQ